MRKKLNFDQMAVDIIAGLGGKDNLSNINHCATRLRVVTKDPSKVDAEVLKKIDGVLAVEAHDNQVQVIVGAVIEDLFLEVEKHAKVSGGTEAKKEKKTFLTVFSNFLQFIAGIMSPVIPALIAAGLLTCLLLVLNLFFGLETTNSTYIILNNLAQSVFYFLPVFVAYTSAKKFDTEPILALLLACWLLYPDWVEMAADGGYTSYFGIPTLLTTYNGAVIQIVLSVFVMSLIDKLLKRYLPISIRHFLKPFLLILLTSVITLTLTAPLGALFTDYIAIFINWVRTTIPWAAIAIIVIMSLFVGLVAPGFHLALIPIATTSLATVGYDDFINIWFFCCTITPGFTALAVGLKTKNRNLKEIAFPASVSALFGGISEPTTYGINYKMPKVWLCNFITSITTALYCGIVGLKCYGYGGYSLTNILLYYGPDYDMTNLIKALVGVAIMAVLVFTLVFMMKWDDSVYNDSDDEEETVAVRPVNLVAPADGEVISQQDIKDSTIASGSLGSVLAVKPSGEDVYAPVSGTVNSVAATNHAITIQGDDGSQVMVHIGIETFNLKGNEIKVAVKKGDRVKAGAKIASVDLKALKDEGVDDTVMAILLNTKDYKDVSLDLSKKMLIAK